MERPITEHLGLESRNTAAELMDIVKQRTGREMPMLMVSPGLRVSGRQGARAVAGS
jgi:hypothetical protein